MNRGRVAVRIGNRRIGGGWWRLPLVIAAWLAVSSPLVTGAVAIAQLRSWGRDLPSVPDLAAWAARAPQTSRLVAHDGTLLADLVFTDGKAAGRRTLLRGAGIPLHVVQAVLAAEDGRFLLHRGVDYQAVVRAAWTNWRAGEIREGASTITQQLARNLLPLAIGTERSAARKVREILLARQIERAWTKAEILGAYLDLIYFGAGAYGIAAAAEAYFAKPVTTLTLAEAAMIAGLIQAPSRLDPWRDLAAAQTRRDEVLVRMVRNGWIAENAAENARAAPIGLRRYLEVNGARAPWYTEHVRRELTGDFPDELARGGLVVETAVSPALARLAEEEAERATTALDRGGGPPEIAAVVLDHHSGYLEAMIGGRSWSDSQFDRLTQACRQPGSAWKPLVYGAALEGGVITVGTALRDAPIAEYDSQTGIHWKPRAGRAFRGIALVADAMAQSLNAPAIDVLDRVGAEAVIAFARKLGVSTPVSSLRPMALGASCVKPIELAHAYAVIARGGREVVPRAIVRVRRGTTVLFDAAGLDDPWIDPARRLDRFAAAARSAAASVVPAILDERIAFLLTDLLSGVVRRGTATAARALGRPAAGKTGTTNDNTDAWFTGFTARVTATVWIGHDRATETLGAGDDGAHAALPSWMRLVRAAEGARPAGPVPGPPPPGLESIRIDRDSGLRAAPGAGGAIDLWFIVGTAPPETAGHPHGAGDFARSSREF